MKLRVLFLGSMLLLPLVVAVGGIVVSLMYPETKPLAAKLFFGSAGVSAAGQSLYHGRPMAALVVVCAGALILLIR